jgi:hypothetical protein
LTRIKNAGAGVNERQQPMIGNGRILAAKQNKTWVLLAILTQICQYQELTPLDLDF